MSETVSHSREPFGCKAFKFHVCVFFVSFFRYLLRDMDRVLPCLACTEDENHTRADLMRDQEA